MAEAPQMDRPGVEVIQQFVATTPTILRPSLQACIVGPCKQVVEAVTDEGTLSTDSLVTVPARLTTPFVSDPYQYAGLGGDSLYLAVNNGPARQITFPAGSAATPAQIVDAVLTEGIAGLTAWVETAGDQQRAVIQTTAKGDNASLQVGASTTADIATTFGWALGSTTPGFGGYNNQLSLRLEAIDLPDPRTNIKDLKVDYDSIRVFISPGGGSPIEVLRTEALVQGASSDVAVVDDGDGDSLSPYLEFTDADFSATPEVAVAEGGVALSGVTYGDIDGTVLRMSIDGEPFQTLTIPDSVTNSATLLAAINARWPGVASAGGGGELTLTSPSEFGGLESSIRIDKVTSSAALLTALGLTGASNPFESTDAVYGVGYPPAVGDEVWVDGKLAGTIVELPSGATDRLRMSTEQLLTFEGSSWYIKAKTLDNAAGSADRPGSNLVVDETSGSVSIKAGLFHSTDGTPVKASGLLVYVAYDALRLDVTPAKKSSDFNLLRVGSLSALEDELAPIDTQNPLALGMYFAMLNAPGLEVTGCGVDETNDGAPEGTADSYARSFEFLESKEIYSIVPMTHSADVGSIAAVHANVMSEPANGLERIVLLNPMRPTRKSNTLVASGARANVSGPPSNVVETGLANLQALLAAAGKPGPSFSADDNVFIMFEGDANHYLLASVNGGAVTVNDGPLTTNADGFYLEGGGSPVFDEMIVDRPFTIAIRGGALANRTDEAAAYGDLGRGYRSKRVIVVAPDTVKTTLDGLESAVPGYYAAAAVAGRKASKNPSQPLTEDTLAGFTGVVGTQERYSEPQLRMMAGGGLWILYQEAEGQPIRTRHQLTTDVSTLLARESSITDALDYAAKTLRSTFRNFVGRFNITTGLIEALNLVCDGVGEFFLENGLFASFNVVELKQDVDNPDELSIVADIETLKPLNKIRITMRVT
jgi:hypothetical protein